MVLSGLNPGISHLGGCGGGGGGGGASYLLEANISGLEPVMGLNAKKTGVRVIVVLIRVLNRRI